MASADIQSYMEQNRHEFNERVEYQIPPCEIILELQNSGSGNSVKSPPFRASNIPRYPPRHPGHRRL